MERTPLLRSLSPMGIKGFGFGVVLLLTACGSSPAPAVSPSPSSASVSAGPAAFAAWAHDARLGTKALDTASDTVLVGIGNDLCGMLSTSQSFGVTVAQIVKDQAKSNVKPAEVEAFVRASVVNLCPQFKGLLP